jgi:hypothetical protein
MLQASNDLLLGMVHDSGIISKVCHTAEAMPTLSALVNSGIGIDDLTRCLLLHFLRHCTGVAVALIKAAP